MTGIRRNQASRRKTKVFSALLFVLVGCAYLAYTLAAYSTAGRSRRYARMSLTEQLGVQETYANDPAFLLQLSRKLNDRQQFAQAMPFAERAVGLAPDDAAARDEWAKSLLGVGQATAAYAQLKQYLAAHPRSADAHFFVARYYVTQDKIVQAQKMLEDTVALDADYGPAWAVLAPIYIKQGNKKLASDALEKALALTPNDASLHLQFAVMLAADQRDRARQEFERALALAPNDLNCREQYARFLLSNQEFARAEAQARQAVALNPASIACNTLLGRCLTTLRRPREALPYLQQANRVAPDDPSAAQALMEAYNSLGDTVQMRHWQSEYVRNARTMETRRTLEATIRIHPENKAAQRGLAALEARSGNVTACLLHHAAAENVHPDNPKTLVAAARDLDKAGYDEPALALIRRVTQQTNLNIEAIETQGDILLHLGRVHEAAINYEMLRNSRPEQQAMYRRRIAARAAQLARSDAPAERLLRQAREAASLGQAESLLQQALALEPTNTRCLRELLRVQFDTRQSEAAMMTARRLSTISPEDGLSQTLLSVLLLQQTPPGPLPEELRQELETRLANAENDTSVLPTLFYAHGLLSLREGRAKEAAHDLAQAARLDPRSLGVYRKLAEARQASGDEAGAKQALAVFAQHLQARKGE